MEGWVVRAFRSAYGSRSVQLVEVYATLGGALTTKAKGWTKAQENEYRSKAAKRRQAKAGGRVA